MLRLDSDLRVYLHREPIDFRAGINSLTALVEQSMQLDPFARAVFAFHTQDVAVAAADSWRRDDRSGAEGTG
ncbi:IS66 family insertion sequence element accessory protein TnpB [Caballeronia grimmiae]|uniref:IS66 family insertion sequence element accessory protein TnpB n=1 Tax=Caballeronia grimmiae TaxID=1071679 RepID=UPI0038B92E41